MSDSAFIPVLRFIALSDVHYKDEDCPEKERMKKALEIAYRIADASADYKKLDAVYVVGDFANRGSEKQMQDFCQTLKDGVKSGTEVTLMMASHEFCADNGGEEGALERFHRIFNMPPDNHKVINGFHFISLTTTRGCNFSEEKIRYAAEELKKARADDPKKPIFFFQHPHISDTVSGSINWGEDALYATLMNFPAVIDFSGHSHAPVNDPRSIHQKHFTSLGTGSLSYFELDEFDKYYGTVPPNDTDCAQMLVVEADRSGAVRVLPYDILTDTFFPLEWKIEEPWNPATFRYTDARYKTTQAPVFPASWTVTFENVTEDGFTAVFPQAKMPDGSYVNGYDVTVSNAENGLILAKKAIWSAYYFSHMPDTLSVPFDGLEPHTKYAVYVTANSFWKTETTGKAFLINTL